MSIQYTYEVISVDAGAKSMEVVYSAQDHSPLHVGVRLPYEGEDLSAVIASYAPVGVWGEATAKYAEVVVGTRGDGGGAKNLTLEQAKTNQRMLIASKRYQAEHEAVSVNGVRYSAGRDARMALLAAKTMLEQDASMPVRWKTENGGFVNLTLSMANEVLAAVSEYVQECFATEEELLSAISAATTVDAVAAVVWPE
jgi:hypothetical protein